ncbi:MAG: GerMN domain-containing protein [Eubacteriales bacterium]|nr:GerMN domain-containing protein [Eubacteriales bacterium]
MKRFFLKAGATFMLFAFLSAALSGCAIGGIRQDAVVETLPQVDPEDGVTKDVAVTLYYRLTDENYLVGIKRSVSVRANERVEKAMIRTLLEGVPLQALSGNVSALFPAGTSIVEVSVVGGIMYVTLSNEFFDTSAYDVTRAAADFSYQSGTINQETYERMVENAYDELLLTRKLAVYSLVNTITEINAGVRVQVLVDVNGTGTGVRLKLSDLGLSAAAQVDSELIEPMGFLEEYVVTPEIVAQCVLAHLVNGEYDLAYPLFSEDDDSGVQKPQYANFETEMLSLGSFVNFTLYGGSFGDDENYARIKVDLVYKASDGTEKELKGRQLLLKREGDLYKLGYGTLLAILKGQA